MAGAEVVVIGAGAVGLGTAASLTARGVPAVVLERGDRVAMSWRGRYEGLRLNTLRTHSTPPVYRMPRRLGRWVAREDLIAYLEEYVDRTGVEVRLDQEAGRIDPVDGGWRIRTTEGDVEAAHVVVATGYDRVPVMPDWPGRESFTGDLIHASAYRNAEPYRGRDVLVVACGITGTELATFVLRGGAARVRVAMRTPPNVTSRELFGMPIPRTAALLEPLPPVVLDTAGRMAQWLMFGDLAKHGIPRAPHGVQTTLLRRRVGPVVDDGFVAALKQGRIELVAAVEGFEGPDVLLAGGGRIQPDAVIAATGYERGLEPLVGHLGVIGEFGEPVVSGAPVPGRPGLWFAGFKPLLTGQLRSGRHDAKRIARAISRARTVGSPRG